MQVSNLLEDKDAMFGARALRTDVELIDSEDNK